LEKEKFRNTTEFWKKHHSFQEKSAWCGPATIQMVLASSGIVKSQKEIAGEVLKDWWGTDHRIMLAYLSRFYTSLNYKENATIRDISNHLKKKHIVILDWWDDLSSGNPDGHYSLAVKLNSKNKLLTLADPSNERDGVWSIKSKEFKDRWYDSLDVRNKIWIEGFMLWIDPKSKITK